MPDMTQVIADVIARSIHAAQAPLLARLTALEAKEITPVIGPAGRDGKDIDPIVVKALVTEAISAFPVPKDGPQGEKGLTGDVGPQGEAGAKGDIGPVGPVGTKGDKGDPGEAGSIGEVGPKGERGEKGDIGSVGPVGPRGEKGDKGDPGESGPSGAAGQQGAKGDPGPAGKDADPLQLKSLQDEVTRLREEVIVLKSIPAPKDGLPGKDGAKGDPGSAVTSALVNKDGALVLTFSDGTVKEVGVVVGKDGAAGKDGIGRDGKDGTSVDPVEIKSMVAAAMAEIPKPKDGTNGVDGLGFDDLDVAFDEQTGFVLRFVRGTETKDFPIPVPFDAGVWKSGTTYPKGAGVTVKGAFFIAREQTQTRPDDGTLESSRAWRLSVKGGRDGKPGRDGKDAGAPNG